MITICENYLGNAYLLDKDGNEYDVLHHPTDSFEFESVLYLLDEYGSDYAKKLSAKYKSSPNDDLKEKIIDIYNNMFCKVRVWGAFAEEITFRIESTGFNWYNIIIDFLIRHSYKRSLITVENNRHKVYWKNVSFDYVINPENEVVLEKLMRKH